MEIWFLSNTVEWFFRLATSAVAHGGFSSLGSILIPASAALASTAVAVVSVLIANRAKNIAEASEQARVTAENTRMRREQQQRLDNAIRDLFVGIATLIRDLELLENNVREWAKAMSVQSMTLNTGVDKPSQPIPPSDMALLALVAAARLEAATQDESAMLDAVHKAITDMRNESTRVRKVRLANLWKRVGDWRHSTPQERPAAIKAISAVTLAKTVEDATRK